MKKQTEKVFRLEDVFDSYHFDEDVRGFDPEDEQETTLADISFYAIEENGCLYHYCGKTRIKVHEHFPEHGKSLSELIENVILHTAKKTA